MGEAQPQHYPVAVQSANPVQEGVETGDDTFWLSDALDKGFRAGRAADMMNLDTDAILAQDFLFDKPFPSTGHNGTPDSAISILHMQIPAQDLDEVSSDHWKSFSGAFSTTAQDNMMAMVQASYPHEKYTTLSPN